MEGFNKAWKKHPPVHVSMAAYVGWGKNSSSSSQSSSTEDAGDTDAFMASLPVMEYVNGR